MTPQTVEENKKECTVLSGRVSLVSDTLLGLLKGKTERDLDKHFKGHLSDFQMYVTLLLRR